MANHYTSALQDAREELRALTPAMQKLVKRKEDLESLIQQLERIVNAPPYPLPAPPRASQLVIEPASDEDDAYLWQRIRAAMNGVSDWTLSDVNRRLEAMGIDIGNNRPQKIRNAVVRHPETFELLPDGRYTVQV